MMYKMFLSFEFQFFGLYNLGWLNYIGFHIRKLLGLYNRKSGKIHSEEVEV